MTEKSGKLLSYLFVALTFSAFLLVMRWVLPDDHVTSGRDLPASLLSMVLFLLLALTPRGRRTPMESIDFMLGVLFVAMSLAMVIRPSARMAWNVPLLVGLAYRVGRWRGGESRIELSETRSEIWSRQT